MPSNDLYWNAHVFVAAIRLHEHRHGTPPSTEDVCRILSFSPEQGSFISKKLEELGVIEIVEGSFGIRLFIRDHLKLEELPREEAGSGMEEELKRFRDSQKNVSRKVELFKAEQEKKKKDLFAEMEKKLKKELENR